MKTGSLLNSSEEWEGSSSSRFSIAVSEAISYQYTNADQTLTKEDRKRAKKPLRNKCYPEWVNASGQGALEQKLIVRLASVQASLPSRAKPPPQLSPISRLPSELLATIFVQTIERPHSNSSLPSQFLLASVCKAWRDVILSTPAYWATIYVSPKMPMNVYRTFVSRSSPFPLDVTFFDFPRIKLKHYHRSNLPFLEVFLETLESEVHRLRDVAFVPASYWFPGYGMVMNWKDEHMKHPP